MKEKRLKGFFLFLVISLFLGVGCATTEKQILSTEMYEKYKTIQQLEESLMTAESNEVNVFAPRGFDSAKQLLNQSTDTLRQGMGDQATLTAEKGLSVLKRAESDAQKSKSLMWEVVKKREQARKAKAHSLFPDEYNSTEKMLIQATRHVEEGNTEKAKGMDPSLIKSYSALETKALKEGVLDVAKATFARPEMKDAENYAPKTFQQAKKELDVALSILQADPTQTKKANASAALASKLAEKANQIADITKMFERRDYSHEDIVLWYHEQLSHINEPFQGEIDFTQPNRVIVQTLTEKAGTCVKNLNDSQQVAANQQETIKKLRADLTNMNTRQTEIIQNLEREKEKALTQVSKKYELELSAQAKQQKLEDQKRIEINKKYSYVESLFGPNDAQVFRKVNDVLIAVHGFFFPVGEAEIRTVNFALLDKIIKAIKQFPNSAIEVSGHTDSTGSEEINLDLSRKRAQNVADFLTEVGNLPKEKIKATGYGEARPIASNETEEDRTKNLNTSVLG
ncbi:MAG: OmpA family protein, partial [Thermodesulfobacteriota bacterium]|nr:OmpA family protein [Thermodesulfobacteriota bacterium]